MGNELEIRDDAAKPELLPHIDNSGANPVFVDNKPGATVNIHQVFHQPRRGTLPNAATNISGEYYNLFVIGEEPYEDSSFVVPSDKALMQNIDPELSKRLAPLAPEAIAELKTFPAIFASENHDWGETDPEHMAYFGYVTNVRVQNDGIRVYYKPTCAIPQQLLNEHISDLHIDGKEGINEFDQTHWTIKKAPLVQVLRSIGVNPLL